MRWDDVTRFYYSPAAEPAVAEFKGRYEGDPRAGALAGRFVYSNGGYSRFDLDWLARWWLWRSNTAGREQAERDVERYLDSPTITVLATLWLYGLTVSEGVEIASGVELIPIQRMPTSRHQIELLQHAPPFMSMRSAEPEAAMVAKVVVGRDLAPPEGEAGFVGLGEHAQPLDDCHRRLDDLALLLNCFPGVCCLPASRTATSLDDTPFGMFGGAGASGTRHDVMIAGAGLFEPPAKPALDELYDALQAKPVEHQARLRRALYRLAQAKGRTNRHDRALDMAIAMEMLLLNPDNKEQLAFTFRLRGAWLLGADAQERAQIVRQLNRIYELRSRVAHGGFAPELDRLEYDAYQELWRTHSGLAERTIVELIMKPFPNWEALILG